MTSPKCLDKQHFKLFVSVYRFFIFVASFVIIPNGVQLSSSIAEYNSRKWNFDDAYNLKVSWVIYRCILIMTTKLQMSQKYEAACFIYWQIYRSDSDSHKMFFLWCINIQMHINCKSFKQIIRLHTHAHTHRLITCNFKALIWFSSRLKWLGLMGMFHYVHICTQFP